jgi:hypothetical protein
VFSSQSTDPQSGVRFMRPFPIVRLQALLEGGSVVIERLSVNAPRGARVRVRCRGCGLPRWRATAVAISRHPTTRVRSMEQRVLAGAVLQIYVTQASVIGKYTSFSIRSGKAPIRHDGCLLPGATRPSRCPG